MGEDPITTLYPVLRIPASENTKNPKRPARETTVPNLKYQEYCSTGFCSDLFFHLVPERVELEIG